MKSYSFSPISSEDSKILILGTMPGTKSLELNQYYGHSQNNFWKFLFAIFNEDFSADYENKKALLLKIKLHFGMFCNIVTGLEV